MISVSYLKSKLSIKDTIKKINESKADNLHVDIIDETFLPEKNFKSLTDLVNILKLSTKPLDIHLMVKKPEKYIDKLAVLNVKTIAFHSNLSNNPNKLIDDIHNMGIDVGIAINPDEKIESIEKYLSDIDYVLVMSVNPGMGGQEFIIDVLDKIDYLQDKNVKIGIDGGINDISIINLKNKRIDNIISGSFICMSDNYNKQIDMLKNNL